MCVWLHRKSRLGMIEQSSFYIRRQRFAETHKAGVEVRRAEAI
jgi:hypothetical protein